MTSLLFQWQNRVAVCVLGRRRHPRGVLGRPGAAAVSKPRPRSVGHYSCKSEHTCDNRSAGLTFSTICIQFWNILRSQVSLEEMTITGEHFFGNKNWSGRSLFQAFQRTFPQMHPGVCHSRTGSQNTGNICAIPSLGKLWKSVSPEMLPRLPSPKPARHLTSALPRSPQGNPLGWSRFAWSSFVFSDSGRPKPCCKVRGCSRSDIGLKENDFELNHKTVNLLDMFGMLSLLQAAFFLSRFDNVSRGMW